MIREHHFYGDNPHEDILPFVGNPRIVLDVGCSTGAFADLVRRKTGARVIGMEANREAADAAMNRVDRLIHGEFPACLSELDERPDLVTFLDVLEHMVDPWDALRETAGVLSSRGKVLALIPNSQNLTVSLPLIRGDWTYSETGMLDITHLRFFTRKTIESLFRTAGFRVVSMTPFGLPPSWRARLAMAIASRVFVGLLASHWLAVAEKSEADGQHG